MSELKYDLIELGVNLECFHASEDRQAVRDSVFAVIARSLAAMRVDSLIVEKRKTDPALQPDHQFYPRMVGYLLKYVLAPAVLGDCREVVVVTDTIPVNRKRRAVEKAIKTSIAAMVPPDVRHTVLHHRSGSFLGLQVADYCNWAIFRKWERRDTRSYALIAPAVRSEFDIFKRGERHYY